MKIQFYLISLLLIINLTTCQDIFSQELYDQFLFSPYEQSMIQMEVEQESITPTLSVGVGQLPHALSIGVQVEQTWFRSLSSTVRVHNNVVYHNASGIVNTLATFQMNQRYTVRLDQAFNDGWICFGYVRQDLIEEIQSNFNLTHKEQSTSVCTNSINYNIFGRKQCGGELNTQVNATFYIKANERNILIKQIGTTFICKFQRQDGNLVPWMEINGVYSISFNKVDFPQDAPGDDLEPQEEDASILFSTNSRNASVNGQFCRNTGGRANFVAQLAINRRFQVTLQTSPVQENICIGYLRQSSLTQLFQLPHDDFLNQSASVCTDGTKYNVFGNLPQIRGDQDRSAGAVFVIKNKDNKIVIRQNTGNYFALFKRTNYSNEVLIPFISVQGNITLGANVDNINQTRVRQDENDQDFKVVQSIGVTLPPVPVVPQLPNTQSLDFRRPPAQQLPGEQVEQLPEQNLTQSLDFRNEQTTQVDPQNQQPGTESLDFRRVVEPPEEIGIQPPEEIGIQPPEQPNPAQSIDFRNEQAPQVDPQNQQPGTESLDFRRVVQPPEEIGIQPPEQPDPAQSIDFRRQQSSTGSIVTSRPSEPGQPSENEQQPTGSIDTGIVQQPGSEQQQNASQSGTQSIDFRRVIQPVDQIGVEPPQEPSSAQSIDFTRPQQPVPEQQYQQNDTQSQTQSIDFRRVVQPVDEIGVIIPEPSQAQSIDIRRLGEDQNRPTGSIDPNRVSEPGQSTGSIDTNRLTVSEQPTGSIDTRPSIPEQTTGSIDTNATVQVQNQTQSIDFRRVVQPADEIGVQPPEEPNPSQSIDLRRPITSNNSAQSIDFRRVAQDEPPSPPSPPSPPQNQTVSPPPLVNETLIFRTNSSGGSVNVNRVYKLDDQPSQFVAPDFPDRSWKITLNENYTNGWICFGYIPESQLPNIQNHANKHQYTRSISLCTDNTANNQYNGQKDIVGPVKTNQGTVYKVLINDDRVIITTEDRTSQAIFPKDPTIRYIPWIEIYFRQSVNTEIIPREVAQSTIERIISSPIGLFSTNSTGGAVDSRHNYNREDGTAQFLSIQNVNRDWKITLQNDYTGGWVCFGFVPVRQVGAINSNPNQNFYPISISQCTDNTAYDYYNSTVAGLGTLNRNSGAQYRILIRNDSVVIQSEDGSFVKSFPRDVSTNLVPWMEIRGPASTQVQLIEIDRPSRSDNEDPVTAFTTNSPNGIVNGQLVQSSLNFSEFTSRPHINEDFKVRLTQPIVDGWVCFGYYPLYAIASLGLNPSESVRAKAVAVCTDNQLFNSQGSIRPTDGQVNPSFGKSYFISIQQDYVKIRSEDNTFIALFNYNRDVPLVPWIETNGATGATATFFLPVISGGNQTRQPSDQDSSSFIPQSDDGGVANDLLRGVGESLTPSQFLAPQKVDRQYNVTLNQNYGGSGWVCFGYQPRSNVQLIQRNPRASYYAYGVGVCTDNTQYNYAGAKSCEGNIQRAHGDIYDISQDENFVYIRSRNGQYSCNFVKNSTDQLVPWIEIKDVPASGQLRYTVSAFFPEPVPSPQVIENLIFESTSNCSIINQTESGITVTNTRENCITQFIAPRNANQGFKTVFDRNFHGGWICIGYVPVDLLREINENPNQQFFGRSISFCTDGQQQNDFGSFLCTGTLQRDAGANYRVSLLPTKVKIQSRDKQHTCLFDREPAINVVPWIEINQPYGVLVNPLIEGQGTSSFSSSSEEEENGFLDDEELPPDNWFESLSPQGIVDTSMLVNPSGISNFIARENIGIGFTATINQEYTIGWVCIGFIPSVKREFILRNPTGQFNQDALVLCTDHTLFNVQHPNDYQEQGTLQRNRGVTYTVILTDNQVTITSYDRQYNVILRRLLPDVEILPFVEINGPYTVTIQPIIEDRSHFSFNGWQTQSDGAVVLGGNQLVSQSGNNPKNFYFPQFIGRNFEVTLQQHTISGKVCIGYIDNRTQTQLNQSPNDNYYSQSISVCTDNTQYNFNGVIRPNGQVNVTAGSLFQIFVFSNSIRILNGQFSAEFTLQIPSLNYLPWVQINGLYSVIARIFPEFNENDLPSPVIPNPIAPVVPVPVIPAVDPNRPQPQPLEPVISDNCTGQQPAPPTGNCGIIYSQCNYQGCFEQVCEDNPEFQHQIIPRSVYVPDGKQVVVWARPGYICQNHVFMNSVECLQAGYAPQSLIQVNQDDCGSEHNLIGISTKLSSKLQNLNDYQNKNTQKKKLKANNFIRKNKL